MLFWMGYVAGALSVAAAAVLIGGLVLCADRYAAATKGQS